MSEPLTISELLTCVLGGDYLNYSSDVEVLADIARMLPAHDAGVRREQMEADCKEVCLLCGNDSTAYEKTPQKRFAADDFVHVRKEESSPDVFLNDYEDCGANDIRAAYAKAHAERGKKEANVAIVSYATVDGQPCDGNGRMLPEGFGIAGITDRVREAFSLTEIVSVADHVTSKD